MGRAEPYGSFGFDFFLLIEFNEFRVLNFLFTLSPMKVDVIDLFFEGESTFIRLFCSSNIELPTAFLSMNLTERDRFNLIDGTSGAVLTSFVFLFLSCEVKT